MKQTSRPNPVKNLGCMKCYSSSSLRPVKSPSNSIRHNCNEISSASRNPKTILEIRKKATFLSEINNPIIYRFFKDFTEHRKKINRGVVFSCRPFPQFLYTGISKEIFQQSGKHESLKYNQDKMVLTNQGSL